MKRLPLMIVALWSAGSFAEPGRSWFNAELPELVGSAPTRQWPADGSDYAGAGCVITNTAAGRLADGAVSFAAASPMVVRPCRSDSGAPAPAPVDGGRSADISAKLVFEPHAELPEIPAGTKAAAVALATGAETNFWVTAGEDVLFWTNTQIAAEIARPVDTSVMIRENGLGGTRTEWTFGDARFVCDVAKVSEVNGVAFLGEGAVCDCFGERGFGASGGWMLLPRDDSGADPVGMYEGLDEALAAMRGGERLADCYSTVSHRISVADDGRSVEIDGEVKPVKSHYLFADGTDGDDAAPTLVIDPAEATITSVWEDEDDPETMLIGSVPVTFDGFSYSVVFADDPEFSLDCGETEICMGTGEKLEIRAPKGDKGKRFYRIAVSDKR